MARTWRSFRLHPTLLNELDRKAEDLKRTPTAMLEWILAESFKGSIPPDFQPGMRMPNSKDEEEVKEGGKDEEEKDEELKDENSED